MSSDEFERRFQHHVEYMIEQQARFDERQAKFEEELAELKETQAVQTQNINRLYETVAAIQSQAEADRLEIREAIQNLIVANEVTRELAENVARLTVQTSRRVTELEKKPS